MFNLSDGYPAFGVSSTDPAITVDVPYPESISRGMTLVRLFFGIFMLPFPWILLIFLALASFVASFIGWWVILFTGRQPEGIHNFITGFFRWSTRVEIYMANMTDTYPPFSLD